MDNSYLVLIDQSSLNLTNLSFNFLLNPMVNLLLKEIVFKLEV